MLRIKRRFIGFPALAAALWVSIGGTSARAQSFEYPDIEHPIFVREHQDRCAAFLEEILTPMIESQPMPRTGRDRVFAEQLRERQRGIVRAYAMPVYDAEKLSERLVKDDRISRFAVFMADRYIPSLEISTGAYFDRSEADEFAEFGATAHLFAMMNRQRVYGTDPDFVPHLRDVGVRALRERPLRGEEVRFLTTFGGSLYLLGEPAINSLFDAWEPAGGIDRWAREYLLGLHYARAGVDLDARKDEAAQRDLFAEATPHLMAAYRLAPHRPEPIATLMFIAGILAEPVEGRTVDEWFDLAVRATFDWPDIQRYAMEILAAHPEERDRGYVMLGLSCVESGYFDSPAPWRIVWYYARVERKRRDGLVYRYPGTWEAAQRLVRYADEHPLLYIEPEELYFFATEAALGAEDWNGAIDMITRWSAARRSPYNPDSDGLRDDDPHFAARLLPNLTGDPEGMREADALVEAGQADEALAIYRRILAQAPANPFGRAYVRNRIVRLERQSQYQSGEWIELGPDAGAPGWSIYGYFHHAVTDEGWFHPTPLPGQRFGGTMRLLQPPLPPYEVEGEFRVAEDAARDTDLQFEVMREFGEDRAAIVVVKIGEGGTARVIISRTKIENAVKPVLVSAGPHRFRLVVRQDRIDLTIDDQEFIWADLPMPQPLEPHFELEGGLSASADDIHFRRFRIRKLVE